MIPQWMQEMWKRWYSREEYERLCEFWHIPKEMKGGEE